ncbi:MBOAT family O-acyltransferase [Pontibacter sp. G13]|uniref:MBOAT family O-acyltransferase n=1 Tax=Pontibacter sp. G13 TaxID=3074898 RepID=UPI002888FB09|nr:MBOAT family O-acyltransferase [Pontibacter sp. G13]WNJ16457.1 MBOAT family O-acyltransferase [Pontibacter sp. G13]
MLYNSLEFACFYAIIFALYWAARGRTKVQNILILASSYFFYGWWDWRFLGLIVFSSLVDYFVGIQIADSPTQQKRNRWLILSLSINLGLLGIFKYYGFFVDSFIDLFSKMGYDLPPRTLQIILPVGISFYTFQTLSYSLDIARRRLKPSRDLISFLAFVSFFPQLVAGPIERASNLLPQFSKPRSFNATKAVDGLRQVLWGLFKKVVVADSLGEIVDLVANYPESYRASVLLLGVFFFATQLYCDFSGYSDMAIGFARMMGFDLMRNFNYPYFARDIMDFWRRWHISLTTWFRDYVFMPLSGGKVVTNKWVLIRNYILTFTISGLWHGANWTFVVWGFLHGLYHIPYILFPQLRVQVKETKPPYTLMGTAKAALQMGIVWGMNLFALVFFMSKDLKHAFTYLDNMAKFALLRMPNMYVKEFLWVVVFMLAEWSQMHFKKKHPLEIGNWPTVLRWTVYYALAFIVLYYNYDRRAFIYFQF